MGSLEREFGTVEQISSLDSWIVGFYRSTAMGSVYFYETSHRTKRRANPQPYNPVNRRVAEA